MILQSIEMTYQLHLSEITNTNTNIVNDTDYQIIGESQVATTFIISKVFIID